MSVIGFVEKINSHTGTGSNGKPYTLWSMKLSDESGAELDGWYKTGFDKPPCKEGDYIKCEAVPATKGKPGNFDVNVATIKVAKNPPAKPASEKNESTGGGYAPRDGGATQRNIHYQNSRTAAIETVRLLLENKALKLKAGDTAAAVQQHFDVITGSIDKLTVKYYNDLETHRLLNDVADYYEFSNEGDGPLPDAEDEVDPFGDAPEPDFDDDIDFGAANAAGFE